EATGWRAASRAGANRRRGDPQAAACRDCCDRARFPRAEASGPTPAGSPRAPAGIDENAHHVSRSTPRGLRAHEALLGRTAQSQGEGEVASIPSKTMPPQIPILGWGSFLWEGGTDFDDWHDDWRFDGPPLRLEFSRVSTSRLGNDRGLVPQQKEESR